MQIVGNAVGLNAGGKKSGASSYYFPLDRVKRVLTILQGGMALRDDIGPLTPPLEVKETNKETKETKEKVEEGEESPRKEKKKEKYEWKGGALPEIPRGTLQTIFKHEPYDEVSRLGLKESTQILFRRTFKEGTGVLVVDQVVPEGPGCKGGLIPGDILVRVNGELVGDFVALEEVLDSSVGGEVEVEVERHFESVVVKVGVQDLHEITPSMFFQVSRSVLHPTSYQQARHYNFPVGSVYVASTGYMFARISLPTKSIIESINHIPIPTIEDAIRVFSGLKDKERFIMKYFSAGDKNRKEVVVCTMDRRWSPLCTYHRDDLTGLWNRKIIGELDHKIAPLPPPARVTAKEGGGGILGGVDVGKVGKGLVLVTFSVPVNVDGYASSEYVGTGVIIDKKKGLVLVDRGTIPHPIGDIVLIFSESVRLDGSTVFIHPTHNFSIISYEPSCLAEGSDVEEVEVWEGEEGKGGGWGKGGVKKGDEVVFVGLWSLSGTSASTMSMKTKVTSLQELEVRPFDPPMYRQTNLDAIHVEQMITNSGGVLLRSIETDKEEEEERKGMNGGTEMGNGVVELVGNGELKKERKKEKKTVVVALWAFFCFPDESDVAERSMGLPAPHFAPIIKMLKDGIRPEFRTLQGELWPLSLADARSHGLSQENIEKIQQHSTRRVLVIKGITQGASAGKYLKVGDILISIDNEIVTTFLDVERLSQKEKLSITLLRDGKEMMIPDVPTDGFDGVRRSPIIIWAGALIQEPHREVLEGYGGAPPKALYVSRYFFGTPSQKYCLRASRFLSEIDGCPVSTVDELREVIKKIPENKFVRVKTLGARTFKPKVLTLRVDYHYWGTVEVKYDPETNSWGGAEVEMCLEEEGEK